MFSSQHYDKIAEVLKQERDDCIASPVQDNSQLRAINDMIISFAIMLSADNPNFNKELFVTACK